MKTLSGVFLAIAVASGAEAGQFGEEVAFLKKHTPVLLLTDEAGLAQVAVVPAWQGRVMTSTDAGAEGLSYGWINRELIASGKLQRHMNAFGGEDRFWMGPEGGQFAIFFAPGVPFDFEHWQTPAALDTEPFEVVSRARAQVRFGRRIQIVYHTGTRVDVRVDREVRMVPAADVWREFGTPPVAGLSVVGYESVNRLSNAGQTTWTPRTGLLSIWILGMFNAAPETTVVVPIRAGDEAALGKRVNADYFGPVPAERLVAEEQTVYFRADGRYRSKIGFSPARCKPVLGSYDAQAGVLTVVQFTLPQGPAKYVNSEWKLQEDPFRGDVSNSYTDDGKMGAFYELESSSPAAELAPGQTLEHTHRTVHLRGNEAALDAVARATLGAGLERIKTALPKLPK